MIEKNGGAGLLAFYDNSLDDLLSQLYGTSETTPTSKHQAIIWKILKPLIPDLIIEFRHPDLFHYSSKRNMELDFWSPSLSLALEYQGKQHYKPSFGASSRQHERQLSRDIEKKTACESRGITLIEIPFWWNGDPLQLLTTITNVRPDIQLVSKYCTTNPQIPPLSTTIPRQPPIKHSSRST